MVLHVVPGLTQTLNIHCWLFFGHTLNDPNPVHRSFNYHIPVATNVWNSPHATSSTFSLQCTAHQRVIVDERHSTEHSKLIVARHINMDCCSVYMCWSYLPSDIASDIAVNEFAVIQENCKQIEANISGLQSNHPLYVIHGCVTYGRGTRCGVQTVPFSPIAHCPCWLEPHRNRSPSPVGNNINNNNDNNDNNNNNNNTVMPRFQKVGR